MDLVGDIFITLMLRPMLNALIILYAVLAGNMAAAIIALTIIVRVAFFPLMIRQFKSAARMQAIQPEIEKIKARYKDDPQELNRRTWRLYREGGVNPLGCLGPMLIQFPIWIGLYYAIIKGLGNLPGAFVYLSQRLYDWNPVGADILPVNTDFLWLDLAVPSGSGNPVLDAVLPLLVGVSTWAQQKMMTPPSSTGQQRQQQQIMLFMFPVMLGFFAFTFPSGLALYWFVSNSITVGMQGFHSGFGNLRIGRRAPTPALADPVIESRTEDGPGSTGDDREDRRGSSRSRTPGAGSRPRRRRRRRS